MDKDAKIPIENAIVRGDKTVLGHTNSKGLFAFSEDGLPDTVTIEALGYFPKYIDFGQQNPKVIFLDKDPQSRVVNLQHDSKMNRYLTEAVSLIEGYEIENIPATNRLNTLSGLLTGLSIVQESGMPGSETSSLYLRGIHSFHRNSITYIVDGFETTDVRMLDPYDIESISILKDAAASVIYGLKGTTGVILINTKRGKSGPLKVSYNTGTALQTPVKLPKFLSSYDYASLYNEALYNDDPNSSPIYSPEDLDGYKSNASPYEYPDVDWVKLLLKDYSVLTRHNLILSGGTQTVRYYLSSSFFYNSGVFNTNNGINTYDTNTTVDVFNLHGNVDVDVNKNFSINVDVKSKKDNRKMPGGFSSSYDASMLSSIYGTPANAFQPLTYLGEISGAPNYSVNPYAQLNHRGFTVLETNYISSTIQANYKLDNLLKGLSVYGKIGFNSYAQIYTSRTKSYATHTPNASLSGWLISGEDTELKSSGGYNAMFRNFSQLLGLNYYKELENHHFNALLFIDRQQEKDYRYTSLTDNYQGLKGKLSYRLKNKYLMDLNLAYSGSNRFPAYKRYGLFPALSVGWIASEDLFKTNTNNDFLKLRASIGQTGNTITPYYEYLPAFGGTSSAYFGNPATALNGLTELRILNTSVTWETALKTNIGVDFSLLKNRLQGSIDFFNEDNNNILVQNAVSVMYGGNIREPIGKMNNKGYEVNIGWNDAISNVDYFISLNYSFVRNKIVYQNEEPMAHPWMYRTGQPFNTRYGYVFDRFFVEDDDFDALPDQSFLGSVQPGDLKYKDLNNDNIIDENDIQAIGKPMIPEISYGFNMGMRWKGIDASVFFQGLANLDSYYSGATYWAFNGTTGNATEEHLGRWQPGSGQNATYPRLSLNSTNNTANSSFWVHDASFLRLKSLEIGYTISPAYLERINISSARFFMNGTNLMTWSKDKAYDPEASISRYPITKAFSLGLNLNF